MRGRFNTFVARHEVPWELTMAVLAVLYVVVGFATDDAPGGLVSNLAVVDLALTVIFVAEFGSRFLASYDRRRYLRGHWIDLVALIPAGRGLRLFRLLRLLRLVRAFAGFYRVLTHYERLARHGRLLGLFVAWLAVAVISATALYIAEAGVNENIQTPLDALWWGVVTLTTVGYGDVFPVTPEGRLAGGALMIVGITLFAAITGTITSFLVTEEASEQAVRDDIPNTLRGLASLRDDGIITAAEFDAKKAELLARI